MKRFKWTCPGCNRDYAVPTTAGLFFCPSCSGGNDIRHAVRRSTRRSRRRAAREEDPFNIPLELLEPVPDQLPATDEEQKHTWMLPGTVVLPFMLIISIVSFVLGLVIGTPHSTISPPVVVQTPAAPTQAQAQTVILKSSELAKKQVNKWLSENLPDSSWDEIAWYPPLIVQNRQICGMKLRSKFSGDIKRLDEIWFEYHGDNLEPDDLKRSAENAYRSIKPEK